MGEHASPARNVTVMPYRRDSVELAQWLASCDALVHAGSNETFGLVMLEAMACGLPVVGINAGAVPEFVDEKVGMLAAPLDAEGMASAISNLYQRDLGERWGHSARPRARTPPTSDAVVSKQLAFLRRVGSQVKKPAGERDPQQRLAHLQATVAPGA